MTIDSKRSEYIKSLTGAASDHAFSAFAVKKMFEKKKYDVAIEALNEFFSTVQEEFKNNKLSSSDSSNTDVRNQLIAEIETAQNWINTKLPDSDPAREHLTSRVRDAIEFVRTQFVIDSTSPDELHQLVLNYSVHYDGIDTMVDVIRNPYCDKNTALYLFWDLDPADFFMGYTSRDDIEDYDQEALTSWDLINHIIFKVVNNSFSAARMPDDYKEVIFARSNPKDSDIPRQLFGEEKESNVKLKAYDPDFSGYGPHCYRCHKPVESMATLDSCPHCDTSFLCECAYCREYRGEV